MPAAQYLARVAGRLKKITATVVSAGAADDGKIVALDATGRISSTVLPVGIGADTKSLIASETLAAGDVVNVWNDGGVAKMRKADASAPGKEVDGFVLAAVTSGTAGLMYKEGTITGLTGLTPGAEMFLSNTPGQLTATPLSAAGTVDQFVGIAISSSEVDYNPGEPIDN